MKKIKKEPSEENWLFRFSNKTPSAYCNRREGRTTTSPNTGQKGASTMFDSADLNDLYTGFIIGFFGPRMVGGPAAAISRALRYDPGQGPAMKKLRAEQAAREAKRREMYGE